MTTPARRCTWLWLCIACSFTLAQTADEIGSGDYIHYRLGIKYKREKKYEQAIEEFRKVLSTYPDNYNAYIHLAEIRKAQGRPRLVIFNLKKALAYNPGWGKAHRMLAQAYEDDRQYQKAIMELQLYQQACDPAERDSIQNRINQLIAVVTGKETAPPPSRDMSSPEKKQTQKSSSSLRSLPARTGAHTRTATANKAARTEFEKGVALYDQGDLDGAIRHLRACLKHQPGHPGAYYYAGLIRRRKGHQDMALINFGKALQYEGLGHNGHFYMGKILGEKKEYAEAISHLEAYIAASDYAAGKEEARALVAHYRSKLKATRKPAPVIDVKSIGQKELQSEVEQLGPQTIYNPLEVRLDSLLSLVIVDTLTAPGTAMLRGVQLFKEGKYDDAVKAFKKIQMEYPTSDVAAHCIFNCGISYMKLRLYDEADNQFSQLLQRYSDHEWAPRARFLKALSWYERGEPRTAEKLFRAFLSRHRTHEWQAKAWEKLGDCYFDLEEYKRAIDAYKRASTGASDPVDQVHAFFKLGSTYEKVENMTRAVDAFKQTVSVGEKHHLTLRVPDALYHLADYYYGEEEYGKALRYYQKALKEHRAFHETPWGLFQVANVYKHTKKFDKAIETYNQLIQKYPEDYWARQARWKMEDTIWENEYQAILR